MRKRTTGFSHVAANRCHHCRRVNRRSASGVRSGPIALTFATEATRSGIAAAVASANGPAPRVPEHREPLHREHL